MSVRHECKGVGLNNRSGDHRHAWPALAGALLLLVLALAGCGRIQRASAGSNSDVVIDLFSEPNPPAVGAGVLTVSVTDRAGNPIRGAQVQVEANMTHVGMVPIDARSELDENARYRVPLAWTMSGDWVVDVTAALPGGEKASRRFSLTVTGKP
jgi:hypothetical protein